MSPLLHLSPLVISLSNVYLSLFLILTHSPSHMIRQFRLFLISLGNILNPEPNPICQLRLVKWIHFEVWADELFSGIPAKILMLGLDLY